MKFLSYFFSVFIFCHSLFASWQIPDKYHEMISFDWKKEGLLEEEKIVFLNSFREAYQDHSEKDLAVQDKQLFLEEAFSDLSEDYFSQKVQMIVAKKEEKVIGLVAFEPTEVKGQLYIDHMAVDPKYWNRGIGKGLILSILNQFPKVTSLVLITRRINDVARRFYQGLGFIEAPYMHEGYNPERYIGYEFQVDR